LKTKDNSKTWTHHGLSETHHIGKILKTPFFRFNSEGNGMRETWALSSLLIGKDSVFINKAHIIIVIKTKTRRSSSFFITLA